MQPPTKRGRVVEVPACGAAAFYPDVPCDCLPATVPRKDEVDAGRFGRPFRTWHEIHVVFRAPMPGFHGHSPTGLWNDPAECLDACPLPWLAGFCLRVALLSDPN